MEKTFGQLVREEREKLGISQEVLAERAGTTQKTIDRVERNVTKRSPSGPAIAAALGIEFPLGIRSQTAARSQADQDMIPRGELVGVNDLPIYVSVRAGSMNDSILVSPEPIDYVKRPEPLARAKNGYGIYIVGDSMEPAFRQGDLALIHPNMPPKPGDEVVVCSVDHEGEHYALIKLLTKVTADKWHLKQYNPGPDEPAEFTLDRKEWPVCHLVVGSYRRR